MTIPPKKVINSNPGDADHVGGNDWDDLADYMNNADKTGPVKINTRQYFRSGKFELRNPADTFSYIHISAALAANRNVNWPLLTANDEPLFKEFAATISNKTLDATCDVSAATGTFAPTAAQYVTLATHASLTAERVLTAGDGMQLVDGGAGGNVTFSRDILDAARKRISFIEDFFGVGGGTNSVFASNVVGTGADIVGVSVGATTEFGVWELQTGTTATGSAGIRAGTLSSFSLGQGISSFEARIKIPTLSAVGEEFTFRVGFGDSNTGPTTDGCIFVYDRLTNVNWLMQCKSNGTSTQTATTTAVGTGWTRLKVVVNAAGTSAEFFIAGSSVGTIATNIPTGSGRELTVIFSILKSAGTTSRTTTIDYAALEIDLTTPR